MIMMLYPRVPYAYTPFMPPIHADGTRASGDYVVFEGTLSTMLPLDTDGVAWLEVFGHQHSGEGWIARTRGEEPEGWGYYLKGVPSEDLVEGSVEITTYGKWQGWRMGVAGFDADGNVHLRGQVDRNLDHRTLDGQEPGVIKVDGTDAYWSIDVTVTREAVTDITHTYSDLHRLRRY